MKFGSVPVAEAEGAILAHALQLPDKRLKKGRLLSSDDITAIREVGEEQVIVARLEPDDVVEDEAAKRIASALTNKSVRAADAVTGRVNFYAAQTGCFSVSCSVVNNLNRVDPSVTLATLADGEFVQEGRMIATVKIIPFSVKDKTLAEVETLLKAETAFSVSPVQVHKTGLIATQLPSLKPSVMDKTAGLLQRRLEKWDCSLVAEIRVAHETGALRQAICEMAGDVDLLIIFGASAITDIDDVIPSAIRAAEGVVYRFGMPVDPGNLLLTGQIKTTLVIGAPGCARSPAENGFDWVLQRIVCGMPVDDDYITGLGVGGLLMETASRPQPREVRADE